MNESRTVLIAGGGSGIGAAIAETLSAAGFRVAISGRRAQTLEDVAAASDHEILCRVADVADRDSVASLFAWARESLGKIDVL